MINSLKTKADFGTQAISIYFLKIVEMIAQLKDHVTKDMPKIASND
jgi:hypothetical protein